MYKHILLITVCVVCIGMIRSSSAARIGGLMGFGHYWAEGGGLSGFALSGYVDLLSGAFDISPTVSYWIGSEYGIGVSDLTPGIALKYYFPAPGAKAVPYIGFEPQLHILSVLGFTESYFGFSAFAGVGVNVSKSTQIPIQASYGLIFGEGSTLNNFTVKAGVAVNL
ncbi:MAG: hypothetical protein JSV53_09605 [candidate division WOR-3 bacterium]|nr:MAG: hypothetical protein JSV53_09605 [candidate division WOR-3 bacterium]